MGFQDFLGNETTVRHLRESIAQGRLPHALILAGPRGSGKYALALMLAQAVNCLNPTESDGLPDFCGVCRSCARIAEAMPLETRVDEAIAAREELREVDKKDTRILIQTHPDVLVIPPDPPQLLIKLGQVRTVIREIYRVPAEAKRAIYIFTSTAFMKEAANSLLKVLEEPPAHASIILLAENTGELLPTIRSRAGIARLGALPLDTLEQLIAKRRTDLRPAQRSLVARLAQGAVGAALGFDLEQYLAYRRDALVILHHATHETDHSALFRMTETYRAGAEGQEKTQGMLRAMTSLLEDLLLIQSGQTVLMRNIDLQAELTSIATSISFDWIERVARGIQEVQSSMRRNLIRSLALDAFAAGIAAR
ncbi:DNA polymerase III subunit delta' [Alloacidobacterium sp.]|uniref:DNA polymerase III subunit n=1 Tax=Alloacidobacterium sp. TaxID=2951999 RepID=UPI002D6B75B7|nr:DNA polymerase III subunit delta' [Alloacidobacterium sp.]HYK37658.1 DNA polymerase III subunit delta' [Alloacidobacterium sp.]